MGVTSKIEDSTFIGNKALITTGAVRLNEAGTVLITRSKFIKNTVSGGSPLFLGWSYMDAGAIYYSCEPRKLLEGEECDVILDGNLFEANVADNKGGALRYVNKNFTTVYNDQ